MNKSTEISIEMHKCKKMYPSLVGFRQFKRFSSDWPI